MSLHEHETRAVYVAAAKIGAWLAIVAFLILMALI